MSYDNACKYLAEKYPAVFVRWLLGIEAKNIRLLKTELNVDPIYVDSLLLLLIGRQILHLEFQTRYQAVAILKSSGSPRLVMMNK